MPTTLVHPSTTSITIARSALRLALGKLMSAVDTSVKALPVARHILVDVRDARITLTATDFASFARLSLPCDGDGEATVLLPATLVVEIVATLPPVGAVTLAFDGPRVVVTAGRSRFELTGMRPEEYPLWPDVVSSDRATVEAAPLLDALTRCALHASDAESRPILNAVLLERNGDALVVVGSNGQSLAVLSGGVVRDGTLASPLLIHRLDVPVLAKLFGALNAGATLTLAADEHRLRVEGEDAAASIRLVEGPFPQYRQILHESPTHTVVCDRLLLAAAVRRVGIATDKARRVEVTLDDEIGLRAAANDVGAASDVVPLESHQRAQDAALTVTLNAATFATALASLAADSVQLTAQDPTRPVFLRATDQAPDDPTVVAVMSLRSF